MAVRRSGIEFTDNDGKRKILVKRLLTVKFSVDQRFARKTRRLRIPNNVKQIRSFSVIGSNLQEPIQASKRYIGTDAQGEVSNGTADNTFVNGLATIEDILTRTRFANINVPAGEVIYYAGPVAHGLPELFVNGASGTFRATPLVVSVTDAQTGFVEDYFVFEGMTPGLGDVSLLIL